MRTSRYTVIVFGSSGPYCAAHKHVLKPKEVLRRNARTEGLQMAGFGRTTVIHIFILRGPFSKLSGRSLPNVVSPRLDFSQLVGVG